MKCNCLFVLLVLTMLASLTLAVDQQEQQQQQQPAKRLIRLPEMISFDRFQQIYNKHYPTLLVKMARARLFAANAFKAFISGVNYMWRRSTKYLVVNKWSDSTVEERRKLMNHGGSSQQTSASTEENLVANVADVERKISEIVEHKNDNEVYAEIVGELETSGSRRKLSLPEEQPKRQLSIDQIKEPEDFPGSSPENLSEKEAIEILQEPTNGWFSKIVSSVSDFVKSSTTDSNNKDGVTKRPAMNKVISYAYPNPNNIKDQVFLDYNDSGCMAPIEDQGLCGCCYIMSAMAVFEYHYCKQTKKVVPFSKQYVIDCGFELSKRDPNPDWVDLGGCDGGIAAHVGSFAFNYGIIPQSRYPYDGTQGQCPQLNSYRNATKPAMIRVEPGDEAQWFTMDAKLMSNKRTRIYLERYGPMSISTRIYDDFAFYGGGVDMMEECLPDGGHAMVMVGHGVEDGIEYWLIRNSQGYDWGVRGHWKLAKSSKDCLKVMGSVWPVKFYHTS